jgi:hypothetical protein
MNVNVDLSNNPVPATSSVSNMDFLADPASRLISQIRALMKKPEVVSSTPGRSPLFHIAAQLEMPALPQVPAPPSTITGKNFADVREEALKPRPQPAKRPTRLIFRAKPIKTTSSTPTA